MPMPAQSIVRIIVGGHLSGQQCLTTFYYRVTQAGIQGSVIQELDALLGFFRVSNQAPYLAFLNAVPADWSGEFITAQQITPVLSVQRSAEIGDQGLRGASTTANLSAVITKGTDMGGRSQQGSWHLPGVANADQQNGYIDAPLLVAMGTFGSKALNILTEPNNSTTYEPILFHRNKTNPLFSTGDRLTRTYTRETVRVMRRRTVGVGK